MDFTHDCYLALLKDLQALGRPVVAFRDFRPSGPCVVLRHDIDFSIAKAVEMARLNREAGVTATFFVLLTSPFYNALSEDNLGLLSEILGMGHEIGLHYDCGGFERLSPETGRERIVGLARTLETHLGIRVQSVSQHRPAATGFGVELPGFRDAYQPPLFGDMAYISDSRRHFRVDDVPAFFHKHDRVQALFHPVWWTAERKTRDEAFEDIQERLCNGQKQQVADFRDAVNTYLQKQQEEQPKPN